MAKKRKIYRVERLEGAVWEDGKLVGGKWVEACERQPTIELASVKYYRLQVKKGYILRVVEQDA